MNVPAGWHLLAAWLAAAAVHAEPAAHALLIGIGDYAGVPQVSVLHGPPNDVALMKTEGWVR